MTDAYELYYWPTIQGRGEFVRLVLEDAGAAYVDKARVPGGMAELMAFLEGRRPGALPYAPPFLVDGGRVVSQTANILAYLGPRLGLAPDDDDGRTEAMQIQLTIADLVAEAHDTHHPIASSLYYEQQKAAAKANADAFTGERIPNFLGWLERVLERRGAYLVGPNASYVDLSAFQVVEGLEYAFPRAMKRTSRQIPRLLDLRDRIGARPRLRAYLDSERRLPFNEQGIFRHYPELEPVNTRAAKGSRAKTGTGAKKAPSRRGR